MHVVDATMFFGPRSGGVKRYLLSKRAWLQRHAPHVDHTLIVPTRSAAATDVIACGGRSIALLDGYQLPLSLDEWYRTIVAVRPSVIEAADPYVPGWASRAAAEHLSIPAIAFYHSDMPRMLSMRMGGWIEPLARSYLRQLYAGFDLVLAPSNVMLEQLANAGVQHAAVQPLGVDTRIFHPDRRDAYVRELLNLAPETRLLVYAGRFAREKRLDVLKSVVRALGRPYHLVLIGGRRIERIDPLMTILPFQHRASRLARWLASCDVFVHAGDRETYGLIAAEAMACGLPVVGVARGGIAELVDESVGALARRAHPRLIADAVASVFARDRVALALAARRRAATSYAWDFVFRSMLSRYAGLVKTPSALQEPATVRA